MSELAGALPPGLVLLAGAALLAALRGGARRALQAALPLAVIWQVAQLHGATGASFRLEWMGYPLELLRVDALRFAFGLVFAIITAIASVYALHVEDRAQAAAGWVYAGSALGVVFAGDLLTFVLFWELMAVSSVVLVFRRGTVRARLAGIRYAAVHAVGGAVLLAGVLGWLAQGHPLAIEALPAGAAGWAGWAILAGVAVNAAIPPLGAWLPDAYPEATVTGSVFLSAFTTKTAVFALLVLFPGWTVLLWAGVAMAVYGVVYAILENDLRRLLAYHIISQVGYMVAGAGMGTPMAIDGATAHAFSHILYKALLFMGVGAVIHATGRSRLGELGGLHRALPVVLGLYAVGAASISGVPLFNGFVSKAIVLTAAGQGGWPWAELVLTLVSVGTFLSTGLKLVWFGFVSPADRVHHPLTPPPWNMIAAMAAAAALCTFFGVAPGVLYAWLPAGTDYHPYTVNHVVTSLELLVMTTFAFVWMLPKLAGSSSVSLDTDWLYRRLLPGRVLGLSRALFEAQAAVGRGVAVLSHRAARFAENPLRLAERLIGRGIIEHVEDGEPPYSADRYRLPLGVSVIGVMVVFCGVAIWQLLTGR